MGGPNVEPILGGSPSSWVRPGVGDGSGSVGVGVGWDGLDGRAGVEVEEGPAPGCFASEAGIEALRATTFLALGANLF